MPVVHGGAAHGSQVGANAAPCQRTERGGRIGWPKRGGAYALDIHAAFSSHDGQGIEIRGLALVRAHTQRGVALEMLHRHITFEVRQLDVVHRHVTLEVDKRLVHRLARRHHRRHRRKRHRSRVGGRDCRACARHGLAIGR